jgi:hypothetical protein
MFGGRRTAMLSSIASVYLKSLFEAVAWTATRAAAFTVYAVATEACGALDAASKCVEMFQSLKMLQSVVGHVGASFNFEILQIMQALKIRDTVISEPDAIGEVEGDKLGERRDTLQTVVGDLGAAIKVELLHVVQLDEMLQSIICNTDAHFEGEELEVKALKVLQRVGADLRTEAQIEVLQGLFDVG